MLLTMCIEIVTITYDFAMKFSILEKWFAPMLRQQLTRYNEVVYFL